MCSCVSSVGRVRSVDLEPPFFRNGDFDWSRKANTAPRLIYRFGNEIDILGDLTNVGPVLDASDWSTPFFFILIGRERRKRLRGLSIDSRMKSIQVSGIHAGSEFGGCVAIATGLIGRSRFNT